MVTMSDVAARAGVSQATVSFVLGGRAERHKISGVTRERVLTAARELAYQRNQLARAMKTGKSRIIGVLTTAHATDNVVRILTGAMEVASKNDYLIKVIHLSYLGVDDATIARCLEWRLAGIMVVGLSEPSHRHIDDVFSEHKIPVTLVDNVPSVNWAVRIGSDDEQGICQAVQHLMEMGHRRIAYVGGGGSPLSTWRLQSFHTVMAEMELDTPPQWVKHTSWTEHDVIEADVRSFFDEWKDEMPTAVVCSADAIGMIVMRVAHARGLRVPQDLSVVGYGNAALAGFADPSLTSVDQSFFEMGLAAATQVIGFAEGSEGDSIGAATTLLLPTRLVVRESTAPPAQR